jgi:hypothetical protein
VTRAGFRPRLLAGLTALALLSGCVLQSEAPLIAEADARLLFGTGAVPLDLSEPDPAHPGQWMPGDEPHLTVTAEGNHYVVPDSLDPGDASKIFKLWLLPLDAGHVAVQISDPAGFLYGLATWDGSALTVAILDCDALKDRPGAADLLVFQDGDCHPGPGTTDVTSLFTALVPMMPEPGLRAIIAR